MKKSILCASLLAGLLLVGCGKTEATSSSSQTSSQTSSSQVSSSSQVKPSDKVEMPELVGEIVAEYDLKDMHGKYGDPDYFLGEKDKECDLLKHFTNSVENPTIALKTVVGSATGLEKAQLDQGPKIPGLKLNGRPSKSGSKKAPKVTFTLEEGQTIDQVVFEIAPWSGSKGVYAQTFKICGTEFKTGTDVEKKVNVTYKKDGMNTFDISIDDDESRLLITKVYLIKK